MPNGAATIKKSTTIVASDRACSCQPEDDLRGRLCSGFLGRMQTAGFPHLVWILIAQDRPATNVR